MEGVHFEKKQLLAQWKSSLTAIQRCALSTCGLRRPFRQLLPPFPYAGKSRQHHHMQQQSTACALGTPLLQCTRILGLGLGFLQDPAVARSWSHPGSWDMTWHSSAVASASPAPAACRRDEALAAIQEAMRQQQEQELAIATEMAGFKKDIAKQQVGRGHRLVRASTQHVGRPSHVVGGARDGGRQDGTS
jgi:hypothetical protein